MHHKPVRKAINGLYLVKKHNKTLGYKSVHLNMYESAGWIVEDTENICYVMGEDLLS